MLAQSKVSCGCHGEWSSQEEGKDLCDDENRKKLKKLLSEHHNDC